MRIPDTKPATELIDGRLVQKMSPKLRHQALEKRWVAALDAWAGGRGEAFTEWRHEFQAPGHSFASLVPDVAYAAHATLERLGPAAAQTPPQAPEIAVEILSAGEPEHSLTWKTGAYLAAGTNVLFVVDPPRRTVIVHARPTSGSERASVVRFGPGEIVAHPALPGFAFAVDAMFDGLYLGD